MFSFLHFSEKKYNIFFKLVREFALVDNVDSRISSLLIELEKNEEV